MRVHTDTVQHIAELLTELDPATRLVTAETIRTHVCGPAAHGAVQELREAPGAWSWSEVGALLGITKQSAHERWGSYAWRSSWRSARARAIHGGTQPSPSRWASSSSSAAERCDTCSRASFSWRLW
jgi:hypothetical protein